jgi:mRNA interferase MazF
MDLKRGAIVLAVFSRPYGKPRPAVVVQTDLTVTSHDLITLCPITSTILDAPLFRPDIDPTPDNGLERPSQVMVDKIGTLPREKIKRVIGRLDHETMLRLSRSMAFWLGLG